MSWIKALVSCNCSFILHETTVASNRFLRRASSLRLTHFRQWWNTIWYDMIWYDMIYLLTAIRLPPGDSSTVHIYTQTIHRTTQLIWEECWPWPVFASYTLAFALQLRKKHGKTSVRIAEECQLARWKQNVQNRTYITIRIHKHNKNT
jgi:hypothetical protein